MHHRDTSPLGNAADLEHIGAIALGATLIAIGVSRRSMGGGLLACLGTGMLIKGAQDYARLGEAFGLQPEVKPTHLGRRAVKVQRSIRIGCPAHRLYDFWRDVENLSSIMAQVVSVQAIDAKRSHWVAKAPAGLVVEWDAQIINDVPGRLIAWRSMDGADLENAGSIHFDPIDEHETEVWLTIRYMPPRSALGAAIAKVFGHDPEEQVAQDLQRFKMLMTNESEVEKQ
jgi:uncharacterized membrane protein